MAGANEKLHPDHPEFPFEPWQVQELMAVAARDGFGKFKMTWGEANLISWTAAARGITVDPMDLVGREKPRDHDAEMMAAAGVSYERNRQGDDSA